MLPARARSSSGADAICAFWEGISPAEGRLLEPWAQYLLGPGPAVQICKALLWVLSTFLVMPLHPASAGEMSIESTERFW